LSGTSLTLAAPLWLLGLLLLPVLARRHHRRAGGGALVYSRLPVTSAGAWRLHLPFYCRLGALALLLLALARPQVVEIQEITTSEGIDIQLVLDVSGSMAAEDFAPMNRLAVAKGVLRDFVAQRRGDRMGLVLFAGAAEVRVPPTTDRGVLARMIDEVELYTLPDGTAIGMGLAAAAARLEGSSSPSRVIVLVSDGDNNAGQIDPETAAAICAGLGIKIHTVAVGSADDEPVMLPVPIRDPRTGEVTLRRIPWHVSVDEEQLRRMADRTGGRHFSASDTGMLREVFREIDRLERTPIEREEQLRYQERYQPFAWSALALLLLPLLPAAAGWTVEP
jgi:Ca-activated chloride channel homolog